MAACQSRWQSGRRLALREQAGGFETRPYIPQCRGVPTDRDCALGFGQGKPFRVNLQDEPCPYNSFRNKQGGVEARPYNSGGNNQAGLPALREQAGMALGIVLFVMVVLSLLGSLAIYRVTRDTGLSATFRQDTQAFYIAEAGLYRAVAELNSNINWTAGFNNAPFRNGTFTVTRTDPDALRIQLQSVGTVNTPQPKQVTLRAIGLKVGSPPPMFQWAIFSALDVTLTGSNLVNGGNVYSGGDITISTQDALVGGSLSAYGGVNFDRGNSSIRNGSVFANSNVELTTQEMVRVNGGSVYAGGAVNGVAPYTSQVLGGTVNQNFAPAPVNSVSYYADNYKFTDSQFNDFQAKAQDAGNLHVGNYNPGPGNYTGIHYVTGDMKISGNFSGDAVWVVAGNLIIDGNISVANNQNFAFIVKGSAETTGIGAGSIDAFVYANGTINAAGNTTVNGGVVSFGGVGGRGGFTVNYRTPSGAANLPGGSIKFKIISLEKP